jgi:hypothetical protein
MDVVVKVSVIVGGDAVKSISLRITNKNTIMDLLKYSLDIFNDLFYREGLGVQFRADYKKYLIKPSKKSGKPDNDLPGNF